MNLRAASFQGPLLRAAITFAAAADNVAVAAVAGQTIRVYALSITLASGTLTIKDGAGGTALTGAMTRTTWDVPMNPSLDPHFVMTAGNAFIMATSGAVQLSGYVLYTQD